MDKLKTFITRYRLDPFAPSPRIMAKNWKDAETQCPDNLEVMGILIEEIEWDVTDEFLCNNIAKLN